MKLPTVGIAYSMSPAVDHDPMTNGSSCCSFSRNLIVFKRLTSRGVYAYRYLKTNLTGSENLPYPTEKLISNNTVIDVVINHDCLMNTTQETAKKYRNRPIKA